MDVSKKYGLEYRLLHAIMKGHPWYGDWGYQFGSGSYGLTEEGYKSAVESLSNLPLSMFLSLGQKPRSCVHDMISYYQSLSEHHLANTRDLFCFLMKLIHIAHKTASKVDDDMTCKKRCLNAEGKPCSWEKRDVIHVQEAILRVLRAASVSNWVSWRALKGAVYNVASKELIDYCLGELGGKVFCGMVVNTRCSPLTGVFEYRLEAANGSWHVNSSSTNSSGSKYPSEENLLHDLRYLYKETRTIAMNLAQKLLDCKQLVKDYSPEMLPVTDLSRRRLSCQVELMDESENSEAKIPSEIIVLSINATVADLMIEAENAFKDVYLMFSRFEVVEVVGYSGVDDSTPVKLLLGSAEAVCVRGRCIGKNRLSKFRMERGLERWTVDCSCGAKDDDGERMLACDICGVWRHTRCSNIHDAEPVPTHFVCPRCQNA